MVDSQRFQHVIGNLIDNALRFAPEGSLIDLTIHRREDIIQLVGADEGSGILENELLHIFDRFWRSEKSRALSTGKAEPGLSIARQLVEAQGGKISDSNRIPHGFEARIIIPITDHYQGEYTILAISGLIAP